jgi:hypothetical protein
MTTTRFSLALALASALLITGCSNHSADTEAQVYINTTIREGPADVDISVPIDVTVPSMSMVSTPKAPGARLSGQQDAILNEWVVTPSRSDGGTVASPVWRNFYTVTIPANGSANLQNYRIFPAEYFNQPPLNQLFPQNGGKDAETAKRNIRQRLRIEVFGKTVAGERLSTVFNVDLNFFYVTP